MPIFFQLGSVFVRIYPFLHKNIYCFLYEFSFHRSIFSFHSYIDAQIVVLVTHGLKLSQLAFTRASMETNSFDIENGIKRNAKRFPMSFNFMKGSFLIPWMDLRHTTKTRLKLMAVSLEPKWICFYTRNQEKGLI